MGYLYEVKTEKFGTVLLDASNIKEARSIARKRFKAGPSSVTAHRTYKHCEACDSTPCTCPAKESR